MTAFNLDPYNRFTLRELAFEEEATQHQKDVRKWEKTANKRCHAKTATLAAMMFLGSAALGTGLCAYTHKTTPQLPETATKEEQRQHHTQQRNRGIKNCLLVGVPWAVLSALALNYGPDRIVKKDFKKHPMPKGPRADDPELLNRYWARHFSETEK